MIPASPTVQSANRTDGNVRTDVDLISDCVHCGFCLQACPTYGSWGNEMDSPRGRIDLMKGLAEHSIALDAGVVQHFDSCLGCMACLPACPSGVRYDLLIEHTRAKVENEFPRSKSDRWFRAMVFALFPYPWRLRALALPLLAFAKSGLQRALRASGLIDRLPPRLAQLDAMVPSMEISDLFKRIPPFTPARSERRGRVTLILGCVQRVFFPNVNAATVRVLSAEGFDVVAPRAQGCCGALSLHAGRDAEARRFARALIAAFEREPSDAIIVNAAGCGSALKGYGDLFPDDAHWAGRAQAIAAKVRDITEFLANVEPRAQRRPLEARVAYHDACHLAHAQRIREAPRALLATIPKLQLVEIPDATRCCGSAGIYNLVEPQSAQEIGARKIDDVLSVHADMVASANPGCTLQMSALLRQRGIVLPMFHPIEILDNSIAHRDVRV